MAMNTYAKVHSSTPTRTLELLSDTFPLKLYLQKEAACAYVRLQNNLTLNWTGVNRSGSQRSHLKSLQHLVRDVGVHELMLQQDECDVNNPADISVQYESFNDAAKYREYLQSPDFPLWVFTDGSKQNGKVGCAYRICNSEGILKDVNFRIPDRCSVFQAELMAIQYAAKKVVLSNYEGNVTFFVDSQAAMQGLRTGRVRSQVVLDTILAVEKVASATQFVWVKSHSGIVHNEAVDELAKQATNLQNVVHSPIPKNEIKAVVLEALRAQWNEDWDEYSDARMSKKWYSTQDKFRAREVCRLSRLKLGRFIRAISGHNALNYYNHVLDPSLSPACRFCKNADETFHHLATECVATQAERNEFFGDKNILENMDWEVDEILDFSYSPLINPLFDPNNVHDIRLTDTESGGDD